MIKKYLTLTALFTSCSYATVSTPGFFPQYQDQAVTIVSNMTLAEKIGQMVLPTFDFLTQSLGSQQMALAQAAWQQSPPLTDSELVLSSDLIRSVLYI